MFAPLAHLFLNSVIVAKVCAAELDSSSAPYTLQQVMCSLPLFFLFVCFLFFVCIWNSVVTNCVNLFFSNLYCHLGSIVFCEFCKFFP